MGQQPPYLMGQQPSYLMGEQPSPLMGQQPPSLMGHSLHAFLRLPTLPTNLQRFQEKLLQLQA